MIEAVRAVTHIAPPDENGCIIGEKIVADGVMLLPSGDLGLCASQTNAPYATTTEVYPDSPKTNPEECNRAQVACVVAGINYALSTLSA